MSKDTISRRYFLRAGCATALVMGGLAVTTAARAEAGKLSEDDPMAKALGYKHDASTVDVEKFTKRATAEGEKQLCLNCALYDVSQEGSAEWAGCSIFQNRQVAAKGWCNAWVAAG